MKTFYVYILKCIDNTYYVGVTNNLERRLLEHEEGISKTAYTYTRRPVTLVFYELFNDAQIAFNFETKIKKWSRAKKEALISEKFDDLPGLSKKKFKNK